MELAHQMHPLEKGIERTEGDTDRHRRLADRFQEHEAKLDGRDDLPSLSDAWLSKSQLGTIGRRCIRIEYRRCSGTTVRDTRSILHGKTDSLSSCQEWRDRYGGRVQRLSL